MLGGDVPWEGSSRRLVSLQAPCHVKFTCVHGDKVQPSCPRETKSRLETTTTTQFMLNKL